MSLDLSQQILVSHLELVYHDLVLVVLLIQKLTHNSSSYLLSLLDRYLACRIINPADQCGPILDYFCPEERLVVLLFQVMEEFIEHIWFIFRDASLPHLS